MDSDTVQTESGDVSMFKEPPLKWSWNSTLKARLPTNSLWMDGCGWHGRHSLGKEKARKPGTSRISKIQSGTWETGVYPEGNEGLLEDIK